MNSEIVNPMPDRAASPAMVSGPSPGASSPRRKRTAAKAPTQTPTASTK